MSVLTQQLVPARSPRPEPLENGDCLSAAEFLRRYEAMPHTKKAELIEGVVYMSSPVRIVQHGAPDNLIQGWLCYYAAHTPGTSAATNATNLLDSDNVPQPDALLRLTEECGGQSSVNEDGYLEGAPELVVEIAASAAAIDLHDKLRAYRRNGVLEYLVWRTVDRELDWFCLERGEYERNLPDADNVFHSRHFPELSLDLTALLALDSARVLAALRSRLETSEHAAFAADLARRQPKR